MHVQFFVKSALIKSWIFAFAAQFKTGRVGALLTTSHRKKEQDCMKNWMAARSARVSIVVCVSFSNPSLGFSNSRGQSLPTKSPCCTRTVLKLPWGRAISVKNFSGMLTSQGAGSWFKCWWTSTTNPKPTLSFNLSWTVSLAPQVLLKFPPAKSALVIGRPFGKLRQRKDGTHSETRETKSGITRKAWPRTYNQATSLISVTGIVTIWWLIWANWATFVWTPGCPWL